MSSRSRTDQFGPSFFVFVLGNQATSIQSVERIEIPLDTGAIVAAFAVGRCAGDAGTPGCLDPAFSPDRRETISHYHILSNNLMLA